MIIDVPTYDISHLVIMGENKFRIGVKGNEERATGQVIFIIMIGMTKADTPSTIQSQKKVNYISIANIFKIIYIHYLLLLQCSLVEIESIVTPTKGILHQIKEKRIQNWDGGKYLCKLYILSWRVSQRSILTEREGSGVFHNPMPLE